MVVRNAMLTMIASALAIAAAGAAAQDRKPAAASAGTYKPARTPWGDPDLRGMWPLDQIQPTPLQRPARFGTRGTYTDEEYAAALKQAEEALKGVERESKAGKLGSATWSERGRPLRQTSLIVEPANGRIPPLTELGKAKSEAMRSSWSPKAVFDGLPDFNSLDRCITRGLPASMIPFPYNNGVRIFQSPGYVIINLELIHETRIIPLDGRAPEPQGMTNWLGSSRGHFEGNTLVIDTRNFKGETPMNIVGPTNERIPTSKSLHIVERLTPTGPDTIQYEATIEDPEVLTAPWKMSFPWTRNDKYDAFEYACHEGNTTIRNYIKATSPRYAADRKANGAAE